METTDLVIGPSAGSLYAQGIRDVEEQVCLLKRIEVSALQLPLGQWGTDRSIMTVESIRSGLLCNKFQFLLFHAPDFSRFLMPRKQIEILAGLCKSNMPNAVVIHPLKTEEDLYPEDYYRDLRSAGVPLAIENMDRSKDSGFLTRELMALVQSFDLGFVLDVQHAFERDSSMEHAKELFLSLRKELVCFHVSGETKSNHHSLVCQADNKEAIIGFLKWAFLRKPVPLILEGKYRNLGEVEKEMSFLRTELSSG